MWFGGQANSKGAVQVLSSAFGYYRAKLPVRMLVNCSPCRSKNKEFKLWLWAYSGPTLAPITIRAVAIASAHVQSADKTVTEAGASISGAPRAGSMVCDRRLPLTVTKWR